MFQHDFADWLPGLQDAVRLCRLLDRHSAVDNGVDAAIGNFLQNFSLSIHCCVHQAAAEDIDPFEPPCLRVDGGFTPPQVANQHDAPVWLTGGDAILECAADQFQHEVDASCLLHRFADILLTIKYHQVGAQSAQFMRLLFVAGGCRDPAVLVFCQLNRHRPYAAGSRPDQHPLARLQMTDIEQP